MYIKDIIIYLFIIHIPSYFFTICSQSYLQYFLLFIFIFYSYQRAYNIYIKCFNISADNSKIFIYKSSIFIYLLFPFAYTLTPIWKHDALIWNWRGVGYAHALTCITTINKWLWRIYLFLYFLIVSPEFNPPLSISPTPSQTNNTLTPSSIYPNLSSLAFTPHHLSFGSNHTLHIYQSTYIYSYHLQYYQNYHSFCFFLQMS